MASESVFRTIREQVADRIRTDVLSGGLSEGDPLREQELAARFGVSRGPIRDALLQLTQEGLLVAKPNCGVRVGRAPSDGVQPLIVDLRRRIEVFALDRGFDRLCADAGGQLAEIVAALRAACEQDDMAGVVTTDMAFHRAIVDAAGDADLSAIWRPIVARMMLRYTRHTDLMDSYCEHAAILDAIRGGDRSGAVAALEANIQ